MCSRNDIWKKNIEESEKIFHIIVPNISSDSWVIYDFSSFRKSLQSPKCGRWQPPAVKIKPLKLLASDLYLLSLYMSPLQC